MKVIKNISVIINDSHIRNPLDEITVVIPKDATDWVVVEHDNLETLYIVRNGKIEIYDTSDGFIPCGESLR